MSESSKEAKELLTLAKDVRGEIHVLETAQCGRFVRVGRKDFDESPEQQRRYYDALQELVGGLRVEHPRVQRLRRVR